MVLTEGLPPPPPLGRDPSDGSRDLDDFRRGGTGEAAGGCGGKTRRDAGARTPGIDMGGSFFSRGDGGSSEEDFHPLGEGGGRGGRGGGRESATGEGGNAAARFSTEWAYRLAVTKLTAQLKSTRERLRGEKEAAKSAGERVEQVGLVKVFVERTDRLGAKQNVLAATGFVSRCRASQGR